MKFKTGFSIMLKVIHRWEQLERRHALKVWRLNSGLVLKQYENQDKIMILAKSVKKLLQKTLNHHKVKMYQKWKQIVFKNEATSKDRIVSVLSEIITNSEDFNRCVENDGFLSEILTDKLHGLMDLASVDMFYNTNEETVMKAYHVETGEQLNFNVQTLLSNSILGQALMEQDREVLVTPMIQKDSYFNREIDMPINQERIIALNK